MLGHLILLPHFLKKLQTQLTFMGQRLTCFSRKLPNPFSLTPVNIIILKKNCKSHLRSSIIHVTTRRWWWGYQIFQQPALIICASTTSNMVRRKWFWLTYLLSSKQQQYCMHNRVETYLKSIGIFYISRDMFYTLNYTILKSLENTKLVMWPITQKFAKLDSEICFL